MDERTVTIERIAGVAIRHPELVRAGRHYGVTVTACEPADPESKGGSEATVKIAKADLVPTDVNLLDEYVSFAELEAACAAWEERSNARVPPRERPPPSRRARRRAPLAAPGPRRALRRGAG